MNRSLVIVEHDQKVISPATYATVAAAHQLPGSIDLLLMGSNIEDIAQSASKIEHVDQVLAVSETTFAHQLAESLAPQVVAIAQSYSHILIPASTFGKNLLPRVAALLDVQAISDVIDIVDELTFKRPIYAGNVIATVQSSDKTMCLTIRTTAFDAVSAEVGDANIQTIDAVTSNTGSEWVSSAKTESDRPELSSAKRVVSGGRALKTEENFQMIYDLADKLGAAVGASRAAVDAGIVANDMQVGQTGKIVAPELYIAIGISGAIQHLAGMKDSRVIVAINNDEEAPIFQVADYGLVADLFTAVPELSSKLL